MTLGRTYAQRSLAFSSLTRMQIIGDTHQFAFEIGDYLEDIPSLRRVDIWAGGRRLCLDDDSVYVPQFIASLEDELGETHEVGRFNDYLRGKSPEEMARFVISTRDEESPNYDLCDDTLYPTYRVLDLGPTTDNISAFLFRDGNRAHLVYSLWREAWRQGEPERFVSVELDFEGFVSVLKESWEVLSQSWAEKCGTEKG